MTIDPFVLLAPVLLLAVIVLLRFTGCSFHRGSCQAGITSIDPTSATAGDPDFNLIVAGYGFDSEPPSVVRWNGSNRQTTFVSDTGLVAQILAADIATAGMATVTAFTPGCDPSTPWPFTINAPPPAKVQSKSLDTVGPNGSLAFPSDNTAGNLIIVGVRVGGSTATVSVSDSQGNVYTLLRTQAAGTDHFANVYYARNIKGGPNTVTVSISTGDTLRFSIFEVQGVSSLDQVISAAGSSALPNSGSVTTTGANEYVFGFLTMDNNQAYAVTPEAGWTKEEEITNKLSTEDVVALAAGTYNATWSLSASSAWTATILTFRR